MDAKEESRLVDGLRGRQGWAQEEAVRRFESPVLSFLSSKGRGGAEASDVWQDTFILLITHIEEFRRESSLEDWVFGLAQQARRHESRANRGPRRLRRVPLRVAEELADVRDVDSLDTAVEREAGRELDRLTMMLEPEQRKLLRLRLDREESAAEIGGLLNKSAAAVRAQFFRCIRRLRKLCARETNLPELFRARMRATRV